MTTPFDELNKRLRDFDAEFDAKVEARANDPNWPGLPPNEAIGQDPFNGDWSWVHPAGDEDSRPLTQTAALTQKPDSAPSAPALGLPRVLTLAASVLIGLFVGWALFRAGDPQQLQILAAGGTAGFVTARGGEELQVQVDSPLAGFATLIALAPNRKPQVYPPFGADDIPVPAGASSEPVTVRDGTTRVLAVVTQTPAGESIRRLIDDDPNADFEPQDVDDLQEQVQELLESKGHLRIAFAQIPIEPAEDQ